MIRIWLAAADVWRHVMVRHHGVNVSVDVQLRRQSHRVRIVTDLVVRFVKPPRCHSPSLTFKTNERQNGRLGRRSWLKKKGPNRQTDFEERTNATTTTTTTTTITKEKRQLTALPRSCTAARCDASHCKEAKDDERSFKISVTFPFGRENPTENKNQIKKGKKKLQSKIFKCHFFFALRLRTETEPKLNRNRTEEPEECFQKSWPYLNW